MCEYYEKDIYFLDENDRLQGYTEWHYDDGSSKIGYFLNSKEIGLWVHHDENNNKTKMIFNII